METNEENIDLEVTPCEEEIEETNTPGADDVSDLLTSKQLASKIEKLVDEKIALAQEAQDNEDDEIEEPVEKKGLGMFPMLLIGGVIAVGVATILIKNRPNSHPIEAETENEGYGNE